MQHVPVHWGLHSKHYVGDRQSWQRQWSHSYTGGLFLLKIEWWGILSLLGQGRATLIWLWSLPRQPHCTSRILSTFSISPREAAGTHSLVLSCPLRRAQWSNGGNYDKVPKLCQHSTACLWEGHTQNLNFLCLTATVTFRWQRCYHCSCPHILFSEPCSSCSCSWCVLGAWGYFHP